MKVLRHLLSFLMPFTVIVIVPILIEDDFHIGPLSTTLTGAILIFLGIVIIILTIRMFIMIGKGTLAPWDPTRKLVTRSLYAYVRNPMILGVFIVLVGEAIFFTSMSVVYWALAFFIINTVYFIFSEEPGLAKRFGDEYQEYKRNVPRWIPRTTPWCPNGDK